MGDLPPKKKRAKAVTTTARSKSYLEKQGYMVALVERTVNAPKFEQGKPAGMFRNKFDAFGFADLVAVHPDITGTLYIQTTTTQHQAERQQKVLDARATRTILQSQNRIVVHGWKKTGPRGQVKTWQVTVAECMLQDDQLMFVTADYGDEMQVQVRRVIRQKRIV